MGYQKRTFIVLFLLFFSLMVRGQSADPAAGSLAYISPVPGSAYIMPGNNIAFRHGDPFDPACVGRHLVGVRNDRGEAIAGSITLSDDHRTLIFLPDLPYDPGATIHVRLNPGLRTTTGIAIDPVAFSFHVTEKVIAIDQEFVDACILEKDRIPVRQVSNVADTRLKFNTDSFPAGYAASTVLVDNGPPAGYYFFAPQDDWNLFPDTEPFLNIIDRYGTPVYYRKLENSGYELKKHPGGRLSFYSFAPFWYHMIMDSAYHIIDEYKMENGYDYTDFHDFLLLENGHSFVMTFDPQIVDMSQVVPGGNPEAIVTGFVMQELDPARNVVLQWRSWDHFEITDTGPEIDLTAEVIDYVHGNTIELESDTSILISSRNMHEVTKIHRNTGEILWRLGGSQNQFEFTGADTLRFNRQHDSRRLPNGLISVFDNGTTRPEPQFSSVPYYQVNTEDSTAILVDRYRHDPDYFANVMGNAFLTPDSTTVIGWGSGIPGITEIDDEGNVLLELQFDGMNYRAYRYPWETNYFVTGSDSLDFGSIWMESMLTDTIVITNNQDTAIAITGHHLHGEKFTIDAVYPLLVPAGGQAYLEVTFQPGEAGIYSDLLTINSDINTEELVQRVARQVVLTGTATEDQGAAAAKSLPVAAYPNPVKAGLRLSFPEPLSGTHVTVFDVHGRTVLTHRCEGTSSCVLDMGSLPAGLYLVDVFSVETGERGRMKVMKTNR